MLHRVYIEFPDCSYLRLSTEPQSDTPSQDSYITCEVGYIPDTEKVFIAQSVASISEKLLDVPNAFVYQGAPAAFKHLYFPGGVYNITVIPRENDAPILLDPILNTVYIDYVLKKVAELIMVTRCKVCDDELGEIMSLGNTILTLKHSAELSFEDGQYTQASMFIRTAETNANLVLNCIESFINDKRKFQF